MEKQIPELEGSHPLVGPEQPGVLPEQGEVKQAKPLGNEIRPIERDENRLLPDELEVPSVSAVSQDAQLAATQRVELDPIGGAQAVWDQVHQGQAVLPASAYHRVDEVLTGLKRAANQ